MFTGIINYTGRIHTPNLTKEGMVLTVRAPRALAQRVRIGSSVSHNGVCLTVAKKSIIKDALLLTTFLMNETLRLTSFKHVRIGDEVNLEPSMRWGDEIGGHFLFGHVDGVGTITSLKKDGGAVIMSVRIPKKLMRFMAVKGSVGIEGISLTLIKVAGATITVSLIPDTIRMTNLKHKQAGDPLNIEVDMLARYALSRALVKKK